jgi:hypothetical protein
MAAAAVLAAGLLAAARLQTNQERELDGGIKILEKETLEEKGKNWEEYKRVFERLAYTYGWNLGLINLDVVAHPWNQGAETAEQTQDRKNIFILLTSTAGPYKYLFHNVANGNAQAAWKALNEEFDARNVAEYNDLVDKFANANQANLGLGVGEYIAKINTLGARLLVAGKPAMNIEQPSS